MPHTGNEVFNNMNAGVQYAALEWPQFEFQISVNGSGACCWG